MRQVENQSFEAAPPWMNFASSSCPGVGFCLRSQQAGDVLSHCDVPAQCKFELWLRARKQKIHI